MSQQKMKEIPTRQLVEELSGREGVEVSTCEVDKKRCVLVDGPAIVLVVTD